MLTCKACNSPNVLNSKYCTTCAAPLQVACTKCGYTIPANSRFCSQCGHVVTVKSRSTPVDLEPEPTPSPLLAGIRALMPQTLADKLNTAARELDGERREVTVLFFDMTDFTALAGRN